MDEIKALAADLGWLSRYPHKPKTLLYLAVFEYACAGAIEASDARAIYSAFADRALANSGTDAVQVSKLRTMIRLADHPHSSELRRVLDCTRVAWRFSGLWKFRPCELHPRSHYTL